MRAMTVTRKRCRVANLPNGTKAKGDSASPSLERRSLRLPHANCVVDASCAAAWYGLVTFQQISRDSRCSELMPRRLVCPVGNWRDVAFTVPPRKRVKHVWTYWGAVSGQLRPALAVQHSWAPAGGLFALLSALRPTKPFRDTDSRSTGFRHPLIPSRGLAWSGVEWSGVEWSG